MGSRISVDTPRGPDNDARPMVALEVETSASTQGVSIASRPFGAFLHTPRHFPVASHFSDTPSSCLRRRPLSCGSVLRCADTLASSRHFRSTPRLPPRHGFPHLAFDPEGPRAMVDPCHHHALHCFFLFITELFCTCLYPPRRHPPPFTSRLGA